MKLNILAKEQKGDVMNEFQKNLQTDVKFYHVRDKEKRPIITVCLIYDPITHNIKRGIALCSYKDQPNKHIGRKIAFGRSSMLQNNTDFLLFDRLRIERNDIRDEAKEFLKANHMKYKSEFNPYLTEYEVQLLFGKEPRNETPDKSN
jgi:hypothetical protein